MYNNTFLLAPGYKATLVASADATGAMYQNLNRPGEAPDAAVNVTAGETVSIGPFNSERFYGVNFTAGDVVQTEEFGGFADFSEEPPASVDLGTPVGETASTVDTLTVFKRTKIHLEAAPVAITDDPGVVQFGGIEIYDFPQGHLLIQCATIVGNLTLGTTGTIIPAFTGNVALGTTIAVAGATSTGTQVDILPATAFATAVAKVAHADIAPLPAIPNSGARWSDGRVTAKKLWLNFRIADDATHTSGTGTFTGDVEIIWAVC